MKDDISAQMYPSMTMSNVLFDDSNQLGGNKNLFGVFNGKGKNATLNREVIGTLFHAVEEGTPVECIEKLLAAKITYADLASLTNADLELLGFKNEKERLELLEFFRGLPNQDTSYESIYNSEESKTYNSAIFDRASEHLKGMCSSLRAAKYKLQLNAPEDTIVGEKSFASHFVLQACTELEDVNKSIDNKLAELQKLITEFEVQKKIPKKKHGIISMRKFILMSSIITGACAIMWVWKLKNYNF